MEHYLALICRLELGVGWSERWSLPMGCALIGYVSQAYVAKLVFSGLDRSTRACSIHRVSSLAMGVGHQTD